MRRQLKKWVKNLRNEIVEKLVNAAADYLKRIKPSDNVLIVHAHDNDSICSAAIIYRMIRHLSEKEPKLFTTENNFSITESDAKKILKTKSDFIIVLDISDVRVDIATQLTKSSGVMIIDHHKPRGHARIVYVNPRIYDREIYLPTTYIAYKIYEKFLDPTGILWIAGVGTLSDMGMKYAEDLFSKIRLADKELVGDCRSIDEELFDNSTLGTLAKIIGSARDAKGLSGVELAMKVLTSAGGYKEILEKKSSDSKKLFTYFELVEKEFKRIVDDFHKNKKQIKNFLVYKIKSKMNIKSAIASYLPKFLDDKILVIMLKEKEKDFVNVSFRRGKNVNVDLASLAVALVKGIPNSNGGGHPQAAGGGFPKKYMKSFMKNLTELAYSKNLSREDL